MDNLKISALTLQKNPQTAIPTFRIDQRIDQRPVQPQFIFGIDPAKCGFHNFII